MSKLSRILKKFQSSRVGTKKWSRYPPTRSDVGRAPNGYFWIKYPVYYEGVVMDTLVELVQITLLTSSGPDDQNWDIDSWPMVIHGTRKWNHDGRLDNLKLIKELLESETEWQSVKPPRKMPK